MSLTSDITAILQADHTLMTTLTGGVQDTVEITRQITPTAFDANGEIKPCALVRTGSEAPIFTKTMAVQTPVIIYFYQRTGYDKIDAALARVFTLLAQRHLGTLGIWELQFNSEIARTTDEALACSLAVQRYNAIRKRG